MTQTEHTEVPSAPGERRPGDSVPQPAPPSAIAPIERIPRQLWRVFIWMLWGDFVIAFMEQVVPRLVPRMLKAHDLSDTAIGAITGSIPQVFTLAVLPFIAYRSDQLRTRWGRRIPFILVAVPFIVLALCAIPYSPDLAHWIERQRLLGEFIGQYSLPIAFGVTYTLYRVFDAVCSGGFGWLIPDVVPAQFMGRFQSSLRVVTLAGVSIFLWFIFGMADRYPVGIFVGTALVYGMGFCIVCFKVKEPSYPPPQDQRPSNPFSVLASYGRECFRHPLYLWLYLLGIVYGFSQLAGNLYDMLFMEHTLKLNPQQMGQLLGIATIAAAPLVFFCGHLLDRVKAQRVIIWFALAAAAAKLTGYLFIVGPRTYLAITIANNAIAFFWGVTMATFSITLLPRDRYAQFAMCGTVIGGMVGIFTPLLCGRFFDYMDHDYRYVYLWPAVFMVAVAAILWRIKRYWLKLGGPDNYRAP